MSWIKVRVAMTFFRMRLEEQREDNYINMVRAPGFRHIYGSLAKGVHRFWRANSHKDHSNWWPLAVVLSRSCAATWLSSINVTRNHSDSTLTQHKKSRSHPSSLVQAVMIYLLGIPKVLSLPLAMFWYYHFGNTSMSNKSLSSVSSSSGAALFSYTPINSSQSVIRLLHVYPGQKADNIRCSFLEVILDSNPAYAALSYTWGQPIPPNSSTGAPQQNFPRISAQCSTTTTIITVDGQNMEVTDNVFAALTHLRRPDEPLTIWVDAICINQKDNEEKEHQIEMMNRIYAHSETTYVWLGPTADGSDSAMDFVRRVAALDHPVRGGDNFMDIIDSLQTVDTNKRTREMSSQALVHLFSRSWWERVWVVQEAIFSSNVIVKCGNEEATFEDFLKLFSIRKALYTHLMRDPELAHEYLNYKWNVDIMALPDPPLLHLAEELNWNHGGTPTGMPLWDLLRLTGHFRSSVPAHKVFGLLSLVSDKDRAAINASYTSTVSDVSQAVVTRLIRSTGTVDALRLVREDLKALPDVPSWIPNLCHPEVMNQFALLSTLGHYRACGDGSAFKLTTEIRDPRFDHGIFSHWGLASSFYSGAIVSLDKNVLTLAGVHFDTISFVAPQSSLERFGDEILSWEYSARSYPRNPYGSSEALHEAFWSTLTLNVSSLRGITAGRPALDLQDGSCPSAASPEYCIRPPETPLAVLAATDRFDLEKLVIESKLFAITTQGYLAMVPKTAKPEDVVSIFEGGDMPFVVRPGKTTGNWELVGECYVHGIMFGEAMEGVLPSQIERFSLV